MGTPNGRSRRLTFNLISGLLIPLHVGIFVSADSHRQVIEDQREREQVEAGAYDLTRGLCKVPEGFVEALKQEYDQEMFRAKVSLTGLAAAGFNSNPLNIFKASPSVDILLKSPGYWKALGECFGTSTSSMLLFTTEILASDIKGHLGGLGLWVIGGTVGNRVLAAIGAKSAVVANASKYLAPVISSSLVLVEITRLYKSYYRRHKMSTADGMAQNFDRAGASASEDSSNLVAMRLKEVDAILAKDRLTPELRIKWEAYRTRLKNSIRN